MHECKYNYKFGLVFSALSLCAVLVLQSVFYTFGISLEPAGRVVTSNFLMVMHISCGGIYVEMGYMPHPDRVFVNETRIYGVVSQLVITRRNTKYNAIVSDIQQSSQSEISLGYDNKLRNIAAWCSTVALAWLTHYIIYKAFCLIPDTFYKLRKCPTRRWRAASRA